MLGELPMIEGGYYFEMKILPPMSGNKHWKGSKSHMRIGIARASCCIEGVIGSDKFGYSMRDRDGKIFHEGQSRAYSEAYEVGDVVGVYTFLMPPKPIALIRQEDHADNHRISFDEEEFLSQNEALVSDGSFLRFYINGKSYPNAFNNLYQGNSLFSHIYIGEYYAGVGLYMGACVQANFGPHFVYPPTDLGHYKCYSELVDDTDRGV